MRRLRLIVLVLLALTVFLPSVALAGVNEWTYILQNSGGVLIDPITSTTLYAGVSGVGVVKSLDGGDSWVEINTGLPADPTDGKIHAEPLAIDPITSSTLYAGTSSGIFKSMDGGASWAELNTISVSSLVIDPSTPTTLYAGTSDGVFKSEDGGANWVAMNSGLINTKVRKLAIDPATPTTLYAAISVSGSYGYKNDSIFKTTDGGITWFEANAGLPSNPLVDLPILLLQIDPSNPNTLYASFGIRANVRFGFDGLFKSTDWGLSWDKMDTTFLNAAFLLYTLAVDPSTSTTLYIGTDGFGVFKSTDGGNTWSEMNAGLRTESNPYRRVYSLAIDPSTPTTVYAGTDDGVFKYEAASTDDDSGGGSDEGAPVSEGGGGGDGVG